MPALLRLETPRLFLTPVTVADAPAMAQALSDPALYAFTGGAPESESELAVRYARWVAGATKPGQTWVNLIVRERATGQAIGYVQSTVNPGIADIAWVIGTPWQGRGYATEATRALVEHIVREFPIETVRALIKADHTASQKVAAHLGLTLTDGWVDGEQVWLAPARRA